MWASDVKWQGLKKSLLAQAADGDLPAPELRGLGPSLSTRWCSGTQGGEGHSASGEACIPPYEEEIRSRWGSHRLLLLPPPLSEAGSCVPCRGWGGDGAAEGVPPLPNPSSANVSPVWCLGLGVFGTQTLLQPWSLHILQITVFPGLLGPLKRAIAMIPALLLLGLTALVGEPGFGSGLLSKAPRERFAEGLRKGGVQPGPRSPFLL